MNNSIYGLKKPLQLIFPLEPETPKPAPKNKIPDPPPKNENRVQQTSPKYDLKRSQPPDDSTWNVFVPVEIEMPPKFNPKLVTDEPKQENASAINSDGRTVLFLPKEFEKVNFAFFKFGRFSNDSSEKSQQNKQIDDNTKQKEDQQPPQQLNENKPQPATTKYNNYRKNKFAAYSPSKNVYQIQSMRIDYDQRQSKPIELKFPHS